MGNLNLLGIFTPTRGNDPILQACFSHGLVQPPTRYLIASLPFLLMVQKYQGHRLDGAKTLWMGFQLPTSTGEFTGFLKHQRYHWRNSNCLTLTVFDLEVQVNQNGQNPLVFGFFGNCLKQNPFFGPFSFPKKPPVPLPEVGYRTGSWSFFRPKNKHPQRTNWLFGLHLGFVWVDQFWTEVLRPNVQDKNL